MNTDKWLNAKQAAEAIQVSQATMGRWLTAGIIPAHRVGKNWRIDREVFAVWLRSTSNRPANHEEVSDGEGLQKR